MIVACLPGTGLSDTQCGIAETCMDAEASAA